ncbi:hypothetical protein DPEC_G00158280 [Dallia pectoralis]|uniref:Uncharacterized protein n=1 Tax=Dallia pectoralis TaxID=75939 RepID=A0ACC2GL72_DALPE|nr:hypothetical protein DPEC_G00158280 [Dallia pectoralis]
MQSWTALRSYFISLGEECPRQIRALLMLSEVSTEENADNVEVYLLFSNNILSLFEDVVKKLENDSTTCVELYSIMSTFKQKLTQRDDQFYGYLTKVKLQHLLPHDADRARRDFTEFLNTAISYIEKWFDNWLVSLQPLSLHHGMFSFSDTEIITNKLNLIQKVSMDEVYDECTTANSILKGLREGADDEWKSKDVAARWVALFQEANLPNMLSIIRIEMGLWCLLV